jgi:hypothetical protein
MTWMRAWTRAVIVPAFRRATAVWLGAALAGSLLFGGNGIPPKVITGLALHVPIVAVALGATWLLLYVPTARILVRQDAASYLRSLPGPRALPLVTAIVALVALQMPWLVLWIAGEGGSGVAVVAAGTLPIIAIAALPARPPRARRARWKTLTGALAGVYARALRRRAGHALVRGAGLAVLAGCVGGLFANNNQLEGQAAATMAAAVIAIVLVPGWAGALLPLVEAHRTSAWLARTLGASERARIGVLAIAVGGVYVAGAAIAAIAAASVGEPTPWLALVVVAAAGTSLVATRMLVWAERPAERAAARGLVSAGRSAQRTATRVAIGAIVASAACVLALGLLGAAGAGAIVALGVLAIATVKS